MSQFDNLADQAKNAASQHPDQVNQGIDQAGQMANEKTGGQHGDHIDQGADQVKQHLGTNQDDQQQGQQQQ
ncbi:antitoxin [Mobilicoccus massiliensis]|uniref:antitoxin n=1 Tax=Mobilicoccus massiliensis TaxID=1522310 RepID=UPI000590FE57|nr:antitoxin [Mobilicoccus massiliensis]